MSPEDAARLVCRPDPRRSRRGDRPVAGTIRPFIHSGLSILPPGSRRGRIGLLLPREQRYQRETDRHDHGNNRDHDGARADIDAADTGQHVVDEGEERPGAGPPTRRGRRIGGRSGGGKRAGCRVPTRPSGPPVAARAGRARPRSFVRCAVEAGHACMFMRKVIDSLLSAIRC